MNLNFLNNHLLDAISKTDLSKIIEIRLRNGQPIVVHTLNGKSYLSNNGLTILKNDAIVCSKTDIDYALSSLTENSLYAFNDRIKNGFLTNESGVRIGLAGECVFNNDNIVTIKNISSINIRIPNLINNCSKKILSFMLTNNLFNVLIVSTPGFGKTTILKDLAIQLNKQLRKNILIIDERGEFNGVYGENIDVVKYSNKYYAFNYCIRSLSPQIIITDELVTNQDWQCVQNAVNSGINIVSSVHSSSIEKLKNKEFFKNVFDLYFILDDKDSPGKIKKVYNKDFEVL